MKNGLKDFRRDQKITQEELARRVKVSRQTINNIEKGKYNPSIELVLFICRELKCSVEQIFNLEEGNSTE